MANNYDLLWIPNGKIAPHPHPSLQRPLDERWVAILGENFDPDKLDPLDVTEILSGRKDPEVKQAWIKKAQRDGIQFWAIGGQHRLAASRLFFHNDPIQKLPCFPHNGKNISELAAIMCARDNRKQWRRINDWARRRLANDPIVSAVEAILKKHELQVEDSPDPGMIRCVTTLERVFKRRGAEILSMTLTVLQNAWQKEPGMFESPLVDGLALALHKNKGKYELERLAFKLGKDGTPGRTICRAKELRDAQRGALPIAMVDPIERIYKKRGR